MVASGSERALDHRVLIAAAAIGQAGTRTARLAAGIDARDHELGHARALLVTFLGIDPVGGPRRRRGSFHPAIAQGLSSTSMKTGFTVAF